MKRDLEDEIERLNKLNILFEESNTAVKICVWKVNLIQKKDGSELRTRAKKKR